jgi:hypothetical protein
MERDTTLWDGRRNYSSGVTVTHCWQYSNNYDDSRADGNLQKEEYNNV